MGAHVHGIKLSDIRLTQLQSLAYGVFFVHVQGHDVALTVLGKRIRTVVHDVVVKLNSMPSVMFSSTIWT